VWLQWCHSLRLVSVEAAHHMKMGTARWQASPRRPSTTGLPVEREKAPTSWAEPGKELAPIEDLPKLTFRNGFWVADSEHPQTEEVEAEIKARAHAARLAEIREHSSRRGSAISGNLMADTAPLPSLSSSPLSLRRGDVSRDTAPEGGASAAGRKPSGLERWKSSRRFSCGELERAGDAASHQGSLESSRCPTPAAPSPPKIGAPPPPSHEPNQPIQPEHEPEHSA
jgi:hypothetical protein